jgi:hypothetical protein
MAFTADGGASVEQRVAVFVVGPWLALLVGAAVGRHRDHRRRPGARLPEPKGGPQTVCQHRACDLHGMEREAAAALKALMDNVEAFTRSTLDH